MSNKTEKLPPRGGSRESAKSKKQSKPRKKRSVWTILFMAFFGVLLLTAGALAYVVLKADDAIKEISVPSEEKVEIPKGESVKVKPVAMVITGLDARSHGGGLNTDVMMVAAFNPNTKKATIVSIPRDTLIQVDGYRERKANAYYANFYQAALNDGKDRDAAYASAKKELSTLMSELFDIDVKYAAVINFQGFEDVIDELGGVEVVVDKRMRYRDNADGTDIDLYPGQQLLNGDKALDFVRYRKSNDGTNMSSDFERNARQSQVVEALTDKLKSFGGAFKIGSVLEAVGNNLTMNMPESEIKNMMVKYIGMGRDDIELIPLEGQWRSPYVYLDETKFEEAKAALKAKMAE
jgi:LCP family protein required for cell wall assembly